MDAIFRITIVFCLLVSVAAGQKLSVGVVGGTNLTANFPTRVASGPGDEYNPEYRYEYATGPKSLILGAALEVGFNDHFSIEASILHRPLKRTLRFTEVYADGRNFTGSETFTSARAWEFPLLFKYTLPASRFTGRVRPFVAAGPSFRTQEEASATEPSQLGVSVGVGAAIPFGRFRLAPTVRYTRWQRDAPFPNTTTKADQIEFLTSFSVETRRKSLRVGGRLLEIGAIAGLPASNGLDFEGYSDARRNRQNYLAGLTLQTIAKRNWTMEVDAIYKPLRARNSLDEDFVVVTWQFPVLAKRTWARPRWSPFVAAGPSFRLAGNLNASNPSHLGVTFGAGLESEAGGVRFSPALRYTRWAKDASQAGEPTNTNAVEVVFGVSF